MSLLNKFIAPELKIKVAKSESKSKGKSKGKSKPGTAGKQGIVAAGKSGMTLGNFGSLKTQVSGAQGAQGGGGGKP